LNLGNEKRKYAIDQLGGKCSVCGYSKYIGAIDIHHIDPSKKDDKFCGLRGWSKERILKEIQNCVALCKNCHAEAHNGT
jgi:5-methylcytosine-specific restriction endonuclease McrA